MMIETDKKRGNMKNAIFVIAICVELVAMMSARAAEKAESQSLTILSDNKAGASEKVNAIEAYTVPAQSDFVVVVNTNTGGTTSSHFSGTVSGFFDSTPGPGPCP
jgi:hypothetical protein